MDAVTALYIVAYSAAAVLYLAFHLGFQDRAARAGRLALFAGFASQLVDIGLRCFRLEHPASSISEAMAFIAWLIAGGYLVAAWRHRLDAAGAFAVSAALVLLLLARVVPDQGVTGAGSSMGSLGLTHVFLATVGVATFALAAALAMVYLVQERRLKRKEFGRLRGQSTPLDTLDRLAARCVSFGFPVFTLAILTGAVWVARLGLLRQGLLRPEHLFAVISWVVFGALVFARVGAGWQGRRAAWVTVAGFGGVLLVVAGYFLRSAA